MNLMLGGNVFVLVQELWVRIILGGQVDVLVFCLYVDGKVQGDVDMVFYGQLCNDDGIVSLVSEGQYLIFIVVFNWLKFDVQKIVFIVICDGGQMVFGFCNFFIDVE